ncbi:hypothetical protein MVEN_02368100 [Mycena venus]|uniref:Uncharacterized protein n=1 Tax=Mycena venus TaxID=2733690 RepID=A0A8H7CDG3_9AGAR|nr:hypothetical protein MVEN_02368100 [Mycena venus]
MSTKMNINAEHSQASTSRGPARRFGQPSYTESEALADAAELEKLRHQTPSPVPTEPYPNYDSRDPGEIMMLFKESGVFTIRDFAYSRNDRRFGGAAPPPYHPEDESCDTHQINIARAKAAGRLTKAPCTPRKSGVSELPSLSTTPPPTPRSSRVLEPLFGQPTRILSKAPSSFITPPPTPQTSRVIKPLPTRTLSRAPSSSITPPPTPQTGRVIKPLPRRPTRTLSRAPGSLINLSEEKECRMEGLESH